MNWELPDVQVGLRKIRGTRDQIANICYSEKKQENSRKIFNSASLTILKLLIVCITTKCACVLSHFSHVRLFVTLWTVACQAPLSMGFSKQNTRMGCHALLQGTFPTQRLNPCTLHWQAGYILTTRATWEAPECVPLLLLLLLLLRHFNRVWLCATP